MSGVVNMGGVAVLSTATLNAIQNRMLTGLAAEAIAGRVALSVLRPNPLKFIPYIGWAITIGTLLYVGYEAYNATQLNTAKMEADTYDAEDLAVFRGAFTQARATFLTTAQGLQAQRRNAKYILIPRQAMPTVAAVDTIGIGMFGNALIWSPAGAPARRRAAISSKGRAAPFGNFLGSWEEYPFAVTVSATAPGGQAYVDRVPLSENWIQGGFIRAAAMVQGFVNGDKVDCYIV
ncbi:MAG TPA: NucA/NucB deoxyribonuclease domain-containing protein [Roseomonas sp.]|jgi:hypothetical protein